MSWRIIPQHPSVFFRNRRHRPFARHCESPRNPLRHVLANRRCGEHEHALSGTQKNSPSMVRPLPFHRTMTFPFAGPLVPWSAYEATEISRSLGMAFAARPSVPLNINTAVSRLNESAYRPQSMSVCESQPLAMPSFWKQPSIRSSCSIARDASGTSIEPPPPDSGYMHTKPLVSVRNRCYRPKPMRSSRYSTRESPSAGRGRTPVP